MEVRNELPMVLLFDSFDKEDLAQKFIPNKARFHKKCNNKFSDLKLNRVKEREQKRRSNEQEEIILEDNINSREITRDTSTQECSSAKKTRPSSSSDSEKVKYFFCDSSEGTLHRVLTFQLDKRVHKCTTILEDVDLLGKLNSGDMIACDAMYHSPCLLDLYRKSYRKENETVFDNTDKRIYRQVLAELVQYMEQVAKDKNTYTFKLVDLAKLYKERVKELGGHTPDRVHTTKLKNRLLAHVETLREFSDNRFSYLTFDETLGDVIKSYHERSCDEEALVLSEAAKIL